MTCGHCVQAVAQELTALHGVQDVAVELIPDGTSVVTVTSAAPLDDAEVQAALDEAGYELAR
jgi:copper chaperone CopZ